MTKQLQKLSNFVIFQTEEGKVNIDEGELEEKSVVKEFLTTAADGKS